MPPPLATVLIPTHDNGGTIEYAVRSVLGQSLQDFELFIVGDGIATEAARGLIHQLAGADSRIRFFDHPGKGAGHGELYRHAALQEARGHFVAYLGDDDLWLPEHLAVMNDVLQTRDFAHTIHTDISVDGKVQPRLGSLGNPQARDTMLHRRWNLFGPSCAGHTLAAYRRLPTGWTPRPAGRWSDLHMWRQWLSTPGMHMVTVRAVTSLHFAHLDRKQWTQAQRVAELRTWEQRLPGLLPQLRAIAAHLPPVMPPPPAAPPEPPVAPG